MYFYLYMYIYIYIYIHTFYRLKIDGRINSNFAYIVPEKPGAAAEKIGTNVSA